MPRRLNPRLATVTLEVKAKTGETLEEVKASTALIRNGGIRRESLKLKKETHVFLWQMPEGRYPLFLSAPDFYEKALFVNFTKGVNPLLRIILEPVHTPQFLRFQQLSARLRTLFSRSVRRQGDGSSGADVYAGLGHVKRAAALNILAKMANTKVTNTARHAVIDAVDHIYEFRRDRIYVELQRNLMEEIEAANREGHSNFTPVSGVLHKNFPSGSYKTIEPNQKGNLQLSFDATNKNRIKMDADIDIYADVFRHFFGEVFLNNLADVKTSPFQVYGILVEAGFLPEYKLVP